MTRAEDARRVARALALTAWVWPQAFARAESLPPLECITALRGARIAALAGHLAEGAHGAEAALAQPGCELPALVALLDLLREGAPIADAPGLRRRLAARLEDPGAAVPRGTLTFLARLKATPEQDQLLLAALERRRARAEVAGAPLAQQELVELLTVSVDLEERLKRFDAARATIDRLLAVTDAEEWRWRALLLDLRLERWESAERLLETMRSGPGASDFLARLHVLALARLGRYDEMLREIDRLVPAAPTPGPVPQAVSPPAGPAPTDAEEPGDQFAVPLLLGAGWALRDAGRDTEAETLFRRVLALEAGNEEAHLVLLHFYGSSEERAAHAAAVAARRDDEDAPDALYQEGTALLAAGDAATARDLLARAAPALAGTTFADAAWYNLGLAAFKLERWQEAADAFAQAASLDDRRAETHFQRGVALFRLRRFADAVAPLRRALELAPGKFQAHYFLGRCYAELGQGADAAREQELYRRAAPPG